MSETQTISKKKKIKNRDKKNLDRMIKKNPSLRTLINKLDLELINIEKL